MINYYWWRYVIVIMEVTHESSMKLFTEFARNPPKAPLMPMRPRHPDPYKVGGKDVVAIVRTDDRVSGIERAIELIGGVDPMVKGVNGEIVIKPNCNTDDPYPRDTHYNTIRKIATNLIKEGIKPEQIVVGDMSGKGRGFPTRVTMENLGILELVEEMGIQIAYFEEEEWVTVKPIKSTAWPDGLKIPRRIYEAERIIFSPILRCHGTATFTVAMKLGVGLIDAVNRDWLHDGVDFYEKMMDINLAYQVDMVIADAMKMNTGVRTDPKDEVSPGIIIASNNMVTADAVSVALLRKYDTARVKERPTKEHTQFTLAKKLGLGNQDLDSIHLKTDNLTNDSDFTETLEWIKKELA